LNEDAKRENDFSLPKIIGSAAATQSTKFIQE
jgi:hypothetical protein